MRQGKQNVLFIHHGNDLYGADRGLLHALDALDPERYHAIVLLPDDCPQGDLQPELERLGYEYHFFPLDVLRRTYLSFGGILTMARQFVLAVTRVRKLIRDRNVQFVYVNTIVNVPGALGARLAGVPVIWHIREIIGKRAAERWLMHRMVRICATEVICVSNAVRQALVEGEPSLVGRTTMIYNAVTELSAPDDLQSASIRTELNIPSDAPLVGMVGRVTPWKGQEDLIDAAVSVLQSFPDAHFVCAGGVFSDQYQYRYALETRVELKGMGNRFHFIGFRKDTASVYRDLDVFVLPSRNPEPFGRVTVEAMFHKLPVIATNHGGSQELVQHEVTGLLIPPSDPRELATAICRLLSDKETRTTMGMRGYEFAVERFGLPGHQAEIRKSFEAASRRRDASLGIISPVLFVHSSDDGYGSDQVIEQITGSLDPTRFYPIVVLPLDTVHIGRLSGALRIRRIEVLHLPLPIVRRQYVSLAGALKLGRNFIVGNSRLAMLLLRRRVRLVHMNTLATVFCLGACLFKSRKVIWHVHEVIETPVFGRKVLHKIAGTCSNKIACVSGAVYQNLIRDIPGSEAKLAIVFNAFDSRRFSFKSREQARELLNIDRDAFVIGMSGRVSHSKGQWLLVEAASVLRSKGIAVTLLIFGDVFDKNRHHIDALREQIAKDGITQSVVLAGFRKDAASLYSAMDIFALPSIVPESFGLVLLEAMASSLPIVAARHGGPSEILRDYETGILFNPRDKDDLADKIQELLNNPDLREHLRRSARQDLENRFGIDRLTNDFQKLYLEMLHNPEPVTQPETKASAS